MEWAIAILVIAVLGGAAVVAAGGVGEMSREPVRDSYRQDLPDRPLTAADLQQLRFGITVRGYAMDQVDDVLARLSHEIAERDTLISQLTRSDLIEPDLPQPEPAQSDVPESDPTQSDLAESDLGESDLGESDLGESDQFAQSELAADEPVSPATRTGGKVAR